MNFLQIGKVKASNDGVQVIQPNDAFNVNMLIKYCIYDIS